MNSRSSAADRFEAAGNAVHGLHQRTTKRNSAITTVLSLYSIADGHAALEACKTQCTQSCSATSCVAPRFTRSARRHRTQTRDIEVYTLHECSSQAHTETMSSIACDATVATNIQNRRQDIVLAQVGGPPHTSIHWGVLGCSKMKKERQRACSRRRHHYPATSPHLQWQNPLAESLSCARLLRGSTAGKLTS
jgi:hypothetical protein